MGSKKGWVRGRREDNGQGMGTKKEGRGKEWNESGMVEEESGRDWVVNG